MKSRGIILQASARSVGNTSKIVSFVHEKTQYDVVDLATLNIGHFDYDFKNQDDDFPRLIQRIADSYDVVLLATPVYWYTMSGLLKVFLDRISDCLIKDKTTGRKLRGKSLGLLICGSEAEETIGFDIPIKSAAAYLGMDYLNYVHTWIEKDEIPLEVNNRLVHYLDNISVAAINE